MKKKEKTKEEARKQKVRSTKNRKFSLSIKNADSIQKKIQLALIIVVAVSTLVLGVVSCVLNFSSTFATLKMSMNEMSSIAAGRIEWELNTYKNIAKELGCIARIANMDYTPEQKQEIVDQKIEEYDLTGGGIIGADGTGQMDGIDYSSEEYFQKAMQSQLYLTEPVKSEDGSQNLIVAAPVWAGGLPNTSVVGVVYITFSVDVLNEIVDDINVSDNSGAYIIGKTGSTVAHTTRSSVENRNNTIENAKTNTALKPIADLEQKMLNGEDGFGTYTYNRATKFLSYSPIPDTDGWSLGVMAPIMDFMGDTTLGIILTIVIMLVAIIVASAIAIKVGKSIGNPIRLCTERIQMITKGDLQTQVPQIESNDETGILAAATMEIVDSLKAIIDDINFLLASMSTGDFTVTSKAAGNYVGDFKDILESMRKIKHVLGDTLSSIQDAAEQVSAGSEQMAEGAQSLAEGATDQAAAVEELLATISDTTDKVTSNAQVAIETSQEARKIGTEAQQSSKSMEDMNNAMARIDNASKEIGNIIKTIESIASQTNLLSLNAAIEAARAGEAGKGFAVVADEIRQLANQSAEAVEDTQKLVETAVSEVKTGNNIVTVTTQSLEDVIQGIEQIVIKIENVAESSQQQAEAMDDINKGIEQISTVVETNSATAEESSATSEELSAQAAQLKQQAGMFRFS